MRRTLPILMLGLILTAPPPAAVAQPDGAAVDRAVERGTRFLRRMQTAGGSWRETSNKTGGETALATLALLQAGESPRSRAIRSALAFLEQVRNRHTYVVGLKAMVFAAADPQAYRDQIREAARWLAQAQTRSGLWGYQLGDEAWDHSNTQYALLGLHAAAEAGVRVPAGVWQRARAAVIRSQADDGGWRYRSTGESYGSMTAANVSNLVILGSTVALPVESGFENGRARRCGVYRANRPLLEGFAWLSRHFAADENPRRGASFQFYWLYAVERAGILSGRQYFGRHDWYRAGVRELVRRQNGDGSWGSRSARLTDTAFAVLFLAKGHKPLLVQKLQWAEDERWNPDRHDVKHLVDFIGDKLGEPTAWQIVSFSQPLEDWLAAPLLYVQGHEFPAWSPPEREKVIAYLQQGGTLLLEACCGDERFQAGMQAFAREAFPSQPLRKLDDGHPVYSAFYDLPGRGLYGLEVGCRTSLLYSPQDLSCLWEQRDVELLSEAAFKLGTNIAAFATGRQALRDRLDVVVVPRIRTDGDGELPADDALRIGQVFYRGDWRPDPHALRNFATFLRGQLQMEVAADPQPVSLTGGTLYQFPLLYMTGHYSFELEVAERKALAEHLRRGGFLLADACCGRGEFDRSFRALLKQAFPEAELRRLDLEHPIFRGQPGFPIETVGYKEAVRQREPSLEEPVLWGLEVDGRLAVVYSPYALGCGLDGHTCYNCQGLLDSDARKLTANIVLYALTR